MDEDTMNNLHEQEKRIVKNHRRTCEARATAKNRRQ
jgi:hypothetical protein